MAKRLTDIQKQKIMADYIQNQNIRETARINNCSHETVKRIINSDDELLQKMAQKKEEDTRDILEYMDKQFEKQKNIIDLSLDALMEKLKKPDKFTNVKDIATVYGVIFDKALKYKEMQVKSKETIDNENERAREILVKIKKVAEDG